jgi:hypothetical protein
MASGRAEPSSGQGSARRIRVLFLGTNPDSTEQRRLGREDVWDARHAAAFGELGPLGRLLITTRDAGILTSVGAEPCSLDVLSKDQALELLGRWSGMAVEDLSEEAREVAEECGYLPLALAMIGAMVRGRPDRWSNALQKLRRADLRAIRRDFPDYAYPDLLRAIEVSLDALEPRERERYLDFAVFSEDTPVPEAVLRTLWAAEGFADDEVQDLLDRFVDRSLLRRDDQGRLGQHDLQYDYVRRRVGDISPFHRRLADAYSSACPSGFATGPDDGYFFQHIGEHLVGAGRGEELRRCSSISTGFGQSFRRRIQRRCSAIMGLFQGASQRGSWRGRSASRRMCLRSIRGSLRRSSLAVCWMRRTGTCWRSCGRLRGQTQALA